MQITAPGSDEPELNSKADGKAAPPPLSRLEKTTRATDGLQLVSRATWISDSPLFKSQNDGLSRENSEPDIKPDYFQRMPKETVVKILGMVEGCALEEAWRKLKATDIRRTGWIKESGILKRNLTLHPLILVSRQFYHIAIRLLWHHLDLTSNGYYVAAQVNKSLEETAPKPITISLPTSCASSPPSRALSPKQPSLLPDTIPTSSLPTPLAATPIPPPSTNIIPIETHGSLVHSFTLCPDSLHTSLTTLLPQLTSLTRLIFFTSTYFKNASLALLPAKVGPKLKVLDKISFNSAEDEGGRLEGLLGVLNRAINLERLGVQGLVLAEAGAKRVSFVLRLNSVLIHQESGAKGVGLKELYLGPGSSLPISFIRNLPTSAPRLTKYAVRCPSINLLADLPSSPLLL
ncbi:hypothetical protein P7C70_g6575, partial [Phenoliferia sp. Uapishka_3]